MSAPQTELSDLRSIGQIAAELRTPAPRVRYAIQTRFIAPDYSRPHLNLYSPATVQRIRAAVAELDSKK